MMAGWIFMAIYWVVVVALMIRSHKRLTKMRGDLIRIQRAAHEAQRQAFEEARHAYWASQGLVIIDVERAK